MMFVLPIFAVVAGAEHIIAKLTGATYNANKFAKTGYREKD